MKIAFVLDGIITCGGVLTCYEYVKELRKRGIEADIFANGANKELHDHYDIQQKPLSSLSEYTSDDVIIAVWWRQVDELGKYRGRKIQFIQGNDLEAYIGDDLKKECLETRQRPEWERIAVSEYAGEWTGKHCTVIPNGLAEQFHAYKEVPKDIDILFEGNQEEAKGYKDAFDIMSNAE